MLTEIILGAAVVGGIYSYQKLKTRIDSLEKSLKTLAGTAPTLLPAEPVSSTASAPIAQPEMTIEPSAAPVVQPTPTSTPEPPPQAPLHADSEPSAWSQAADTVMGMVKANPFASLGVLLVLVGIGFLFSLLATRNILPPPLRVLFVALAGVGVFAFGFRQEESRPSFAMNLQGGALAIEFLCALWAYQGYGLVSPTAAFVWMGGLSTLALGWAAYKKRGMFAFGFGRFAPYAGYRRHRLGGVFRSGAVLRLD